MHSRALWLAKNEQQVLFLWMHDSESVKVKLSVIKTRLVCHKNTAGMSVMKKYTCNACLEILQHLNYNNAIALNLKIQRGMKIVS